jgi:hypothetical protein
LNLGHPLYGEILPDHVQPLVLLTHHRVDPDIGLSCHFQCVNGLDLINATSGLQVLGDELFRRLCGGSRRQAKYSHDNHSGHTHNASCSCCEL